MTHQSAASQGISRRGKAALTLLSACIAWFIVYILDQRLWWAPMLFYICLVIGLILLIIELRKKRKGEQAPAAGLATTTSQTKQATEATTNPTYIDLSTAYRPATVILLNNRYEITEKTAEGGMAVINLAKDHQAKTQCIIKIPRTNTPHEPKINMEKLTIEAEHLRKFNHPHIVRFIDLFQYHHMPHLVVEYIEGDSLLNTFTRSPADEGLALMWAGQILDAIEYIHRLGFIHRDLNPGNIMIRHDNTAVIIDFGTVKDISAKDHPETRNYTIITKPGFSIPELLTTGHADGRADLCGVGNTIFYLLTSTRPRLQGNNTDIADLLMSRQVSERTAKCIAQAMNMDPDLRFKDARAMRLALGV